MEEIKGLLVMSAPDTTSKPTGSGRHMMASFFGNPSFDDTEVPINKITNEECIESFVNLLKENSNLLISNEWNSFTEKLFFSKLKDAAFVSENWSVVEYDKPSFERANEIKEEIKKLNGYIPNPHGSGTDMQLVIFENDEWGREDKGFRFTTVIEWGEIIGHYILIDYEQEFFI